MTRIRSAAQRAPQSTEQAMVLLDRFATLDSELALAEANRQEALAATNAVADSIAIPLIAELKDIAKQLKPWWAASYDELTQGKRKSIELGGCMIGYRISPPKVTYSGGTDAEAVTAVAASAYAEQIIRNTLSLDKPAILKLLEGDDSAALAELGFASKQSEVFFVERVAQAGTLSGAARTA